MIKTLAKNSYELYTLLEKKYGNRFKADELLAMRGRIEGAIDANEISITFDGKEYLLISTNSNSKEILDELQPFLTAIMGNEKPICYYDLQSEGLEIRPTIEWDIVNPENRLKEIVNGRAFSDKSKILNLKLYNNKKISNYIESKQEKENRIKNAKIYGIYPGSIKDVEKINELDEINLYFMIDALGGHIWRCRHDMSHGRIPEFDLTEEQYALEYMVYQTKKFGVELEEPEIDKHIIATPSYRAWFNFYDNHFKNVLNNEQWNTFQQKQINGEDVSEYLPNGNWKETLEQPKQKKL